MHWYVQVQNQVYGPYDDGQMQGFVSEGRVNSGSLISNNVDTGFYAALGFDIFSLWAGTGQNVAAASGGAAATPYYQTQQQHIQPEQQAQQSQQHYQATPTPTATEAPTEQFVEPAVSTQSVFLIMAEIRSSGAMGFLKALQSFGQAQRIGDTVWLLRSAHSVQQLRNTLSQSLDRQDRLFILDSSANKTAWFNIGADLDSRIRQLWSEDED